MSLNIPQTERLSPVGTLPRRSRSRTSILMTLRLGDLAVIFLAGWLAQQVRFGTGEVISEYALLTTLGAACFYAFSHMAGSYHTIRLKDPFAGMSRPFTAWSLAVLCVLLICFASKTSADYSRLWFSLWWSIGTLGIVTSRLIVMQRVRAAELRGDLMDQAVLIDGRRTATDLTDLLAAGHVRVVHTARWAPQSAEDERTVAPPLRKLADSIGDLCRTRPIDRVLVALDFTDETALRQAVSAFKFLPVETTVLPPVQTLQRWRAAGTNHELPCLETIARQPLSAVDRFWKRGMDLGFGLLLLIAFSPLMVLLALAIKLDSPGPVFFRQARCGFGGGAFYVWKFRSMTVDACASTKVEQAQRHDPRVTRVGALIRRTSLDELPQLFNVILGDMSLVGPRPHAVQHDTAFSNDVVEYLARHRVKPGMTGLAQVRGFRGEISNRDALEQRIANDLWYAENWSILLDLRILVMTAFILAGRNAY